jgi:Glyoxalase-like domain
MSESAAGVGRLSLALIDCPDVDVTDLTAAAARALELAPKPAGDVHRTSQPWRTYPDPAGHPFCLATV